MLDLLLTKLLPESIEGIARYTETTSDTEAAALLKQLETGELRTIVSSSTLPHLIAFPFVEHVVFCHLASNQDTFFKRCAPAFATAETSYLHLIYNTTDEAEMHNWILEKYPTGDELRRLYGHIRSVIQSNGTDGYPEAEILKGGFGTLSALQTGLTIFEELQFIERQGQPGSRRVKLLSGKKNDLSRSPTYLRGEWIKQTSPAFIAFQLKENIESMWERIEHEYQILSEPNPSL